MESVRVARVLLGVLLMVGSAAAAQEGGFLKRLGIGRSSELTEGKIADGLREVLTVGIDRTVTQVGKSDGYLKNDKIRIRPPKAIERFERPLRAAGYGPQIDEFVLSMNRAAEEAAPVAKEIFVNAIAQMTIEDARGILKGSDTAATDYLHEHTREQLTELFLPHVKTTMEKYEVTAKYREVTGRVADLPFASGIGEDSVEKYTVSKALDGLFYMLGEEEKRIRKDPAARATDLLKTVFK